MNHLEWNRQEEIHLELNHLELNHLEVVHQEWKCQEAVDLNQEWNHLEVAVVDQEEMVITLEEEEEEEALSPPRSREHEASEKSTAMQAPTRAVRDM